MKTIFTIPAVIISLLLGLPCLVSFSTIASENIQKPEEVIRMAVFPRRNAQQTTQMFSPLAQYLSEKIGKKVQLIVTKDFDAFWAGVITKQYDLVHYNPYHYVRSHKELGYHVILKNEEQGSDSITGALLVRKDSGIQSIEDLRGKKIVFGGGPKAMYAYIVPTFLLRKSGLQAKDYIQDFAKNPPNAVFATYFGQAQASGVGDVSLNMPVVKKRIDTSKLEYLMTGKQLTHLPWAVNAEMPVDLRNKLQDILAGLKQSPEGKKILDKAQLTGLNVTTDEEYDIHRYIIWEAVQENYCVRNCGYTQKTPVVVSRQKPLVLGIFPRRSKKWTIEMFTPMARHLSRELGREVQIEAEKTFDAFWEKVSRQHYDIVHYNQLQYVKSHKLFNYNIIAKIEERGSDTITPALLVHKDSGINKTQDLRGKKVLFSGDRTAMVSYVANTQLLRKAGLNPGDYQESFTLSPWDACEAMAKGQADSCGVSTNCLLLDRLRDKKGFRQLKILTQGEPMPQLVWSVSNKVNDGLRRKIQHILINLHDSNEGADALEAAWLSDIHSARDEEYDIHRKVIHDVLGEVY